MNGLIIDRIAKTPAGKQAKLREWLDIIDNPPADVSELVDIICRGKQQYLGPCRNLLSAIANASEIETLSGQLGDVADDSTRESVYWTIEAGLHRVRSAVASRVYTNVAGSLCSDIAAHSENSGPPSITIIAGVYATVACGLYAYGQVEQPNNQRPLSAGLKSDLIESINNRVQWVEMGGQDPLQFWGFVGALFSNEKVNWLLKSEG